MKLARFDDDRLGRVDGADLVDVRAALNWLPAERWPLRPGDIMRCRIEGIGEMTVAVR